MTHLFFKLSCDRLFMTGESLQREPSSRAQRQV